MTHGKGLSGCVVVRFNDCVADNCWKTLKMLEIMLAGAIAKESVKENLLQLLKLCRFSDIPLLKES